MVPMMTIECIESCEPGDTVYYLGKYRGEVLHVLSFTSKAAIVVMKDGPIRGECTLTFKNLSKERDDTPTISPKSRR